MNRTPPAGAQRGGTFVGIIIGLLIGLGLALLVALYIAKVPVPFVEKVPHRTPEQDAAEIERNRNWDPNAPLAGKQAGKPVNDAAAPAASAPATAPAAPAVVPDKRAAASAPSPTAPAAEPAKPGRDPAAILSGQSPAGTDAASKDPFVYFVQAGAYSNADDAEQQRARLAMQGMTAKVTEREQGGRTVHRVRLGPYDTRAEAEALQDRLKAGGAEAVLVRLERPH
ncbi:SPOR domain-containing protein [Ideonella sp. 4Y16]|uniref:SPOR domain-containing protein n=1 Tax=Ideonella alba TaxID=2824118 RepID=A0A940YG55_9BURK|nr:SPOR domain-containing protein [Ideonella alba]MBQ0932696.1 SPOR domain-containing protein [Ideonella alba]MBQ0943446.1 SPOR domain-containing protein [Ideonella alba]